MQKDGKNVKKVINQLNYLLDDEEARILPSSTSDSELANGMASFFSNKICEIRENIEHSLDNHSNEHYISSSPICHSSFSEFQSVSENDISDILSDINSKFNPEDPIQVHYLEDNSTYFKPILTKIVNQSFTSSVFPTELKHATVTPIYKPHSTDPEVLKNYRPVSTLPYLSKVIEKAAMLQITRYLNSNQLIPSYQSAYLKGHSCETALLKVTTDIQKLGCSKQNGHPRAIGLKCGF